MKSCILFVLLCISLPLCAQDKFDNLHILERNKERIKATGDLRGSFKLMKVVVQFRDNDLLITGNDYRYGYITVVPYTEITSLTFSDIDSDLPRDMREQAPLHQKDFSGQSQRWLQLMHDQTEILLHLAKEDPNAFLQAISTHTNQVITITTDGLSRQLNDVAFRQSRIVQTITDRKGKPKTDDYACIMILSDDGLLIKGKDKNFQGQIDLPYTQIQSLSYEHAKESSYMGRMPGFGAFRKPKHWFVIRNTDNLQIPLLFDIDEVAIFREAIENRSKLTINAQAPNIQATPTVQTLIPETLESQPAPTTQLTQAQTIRCTLGPGQRVDWSNQTLNHDQNARYSDHAPEILFEKIDISAQTAQMRMGDLTHNARVISNSNTLTFVVLIDNNTQITSIISQNGRLISIHSHHAGGQTPQAGQFYGVAEIVK